MAWATVHVGIIGFDFDMFRAELCFKGGIEYGLNILKVIEIKTMCDDDCCGTENTLATSLHDMRTW